MALFPGALPSFAGFTASHTLAADNHAAQHNLEQAEIVNIATKVGTGSSTPVVATVLKGTGPGTSAWSQVQLSTDVTGQLPAANALNVLQTVYPVGCIYTETTGTNPNTTFGFGGWVAFGSGQVLVGNGTSDQTFTAGATGGESNHNLTTAELASHSHGITDPGHSHTAGDGSGYVVGGASGSAASITQAGASFKVASGNNSNTGVTVNNAGSGTAHNNLQPYIVVYFWKRTT